MGTEVAVITQGQIVGPESEFEKKRLALRSQFSEAVEAAKLITAITSPEQAELATQIGRTLQAGVKETEACFKSVKVKIDEIKKPILEAEKQDVGLLNTEKDRLGRLTLVYNNKVDAERREADRIAREAAERAAQEEQLARAIELEESGDLEQASALLDEPVVAAPVFTQAAAPARVTGQVAKKTYSAQVENLMELVKAVAAGKAPLQALKADESFINAQARSFKEGFSMPGCKLKTDENVHFRA